jgi:hypothetical protein
LAISPDQCGQFPRNARARKGWYRQSAPDSRGCSDR